MVSQSCLVSRYEAGNCKNSVGLKPIAVRLSNPAESLVPTLCVGMHPGRSASSVLGVRDTSTGDAERPICIPTQSVGTSGFD